MDFLLKNEEISIEVKMTRNGLKNKELGDQLIIDIANIRLIQNVNFYIVLYLIPKYIYEIFAVLSMI